VQLVPLAVGMVAALVTGLAAIHFLLRYLRTNTLAVFVAYRVVLAAILVIFFLGFFTMLTNFFYSQSLPTAFAMLLALCLATAAALTGGVRNNTGQSDEFFVTFTFSLKVHPRYGLGSDSVKPYSLLGR
jgi:hypothetical protein